MTAIFVLDAEIDIDQFYENQNFFQGFQTLIYLINKVQSKQ